MFGVSPVHPVAVVLYGAIAAITAAQYPVSGSGAMLIFVCGVGALWHAGFMWRVKAARRLLESAAFEPMETIAAPNLGARLSLAAGLDKEDQNVGIEVAIIDVVFRQTEPFKAYDIARQMSVSTPLVRPVLNTLAAVGRLNRRYDEKSGSYIFEVNRDD